MTLTDAAEAAWGIYRAAVKAVDPYKLTAAHSERVLTALRSSGRRRLLVAGFGKASCPMARALEDSLGGLIEQGIVITKYGHCEESRPSRIRVIEAGHPLPDENGLRGTEETVRLLRDAGEESLLVCLISGGGSALLVSPYEGISLEDKNKATEILLNAGADIFDLNTVRKHISAVKGGRLAETAYPATIMSLILSDVIGDRLDIIASGPTYPDLTIYRDALKVIEKYGVGDRIPQSVTAFLTKGAHGLFPETLKDSSPVFQHVENILVGNNKKAVTAAAEKAQMLGYETTVVSTELRGEARDVAKRLARKALEVKGTKDAESRSCLLYGGETTVTVQGKGRGGRNMELALAFSIEIEGTGGITLLSAGTDGTDGPTDAAGAVVDGNTIPRAKSLGLDARKYLRNNDSYHFFEKAGGLFVTGPTGTNVMDIDILIIR